MEEAEDFENIIDESQDYLLFQADDLADDLQSLFDDNDNEMDRVFMIKNLIHRENDLIKKAEKNQKLQQTSNKLTPSQDKHDSE